MNLPGSPPNMLDSTFNLNSLFSKNTIRTKDYSIESATFSKKTRRTSLSNETKMKLDSLKPIMPNVSKTTTNKTWALRDYLPFLKNEKISSLMSVDNVNISNKSEQTDSKLRRISSISALFSPRLESKASKFMDFSNINRNKSKECDRYYEIYK